MANPRTPVKKPKKPDLSQETTTSPEGHRFLVWLWIIGLILLSLAIWGIAYLASFLRPGQHGNPLFP